MNRLMSLQKLKKIHHLLQKVKQNLNSKLMILLLTLVRFQMPVIMIQVHSHLSNLHNQIITLQIHLLKTLHQNQLEVVKQLLNKHRMLQNQVSHLIHKQLTTLNQIQNLSNLNVLVYLSKYLILITILPFHGAQTKKDHKLKLAGHNILKMATLKIVQLKNAC